MAPEEIYKGFWTNWAEGHVRGATLTLSRRDGAYLIAFLALFVHVAGASFWRLTSFIVFTSKARPNLDDGITLQQQTILRNSTSAISGLRGFIRIFIRSRKLRQNIPMILWSGLNFGFWLAAGILSSKVTSTQSDVLLMPIRCGHWWRSADGPVLNKTDLFNIGVSSSAIANLQGSSCKKASTCYGNNSISNSCVNPGRRALSWKTSLSSSCPFGDLCADQTLSLDSGFLDSDLDLGINVPSKDRISLRLGLQCSPLKQDDYMKLYSGENISSLINPEPYMKAKYAFNQPIEQFGFEAFFYGPTSLSAATKSSATFIFNNGTIAYSMSPQPKTAIVSLSVANAEFSPSGRLIEGAFSTFNPLSQLVLPGRQVSLMFLSIGPWTSMRAVTDPWFRIDQPFATSVQYPGDSESTNITEYFRQPYTTVLGCASSTDMCHGTSDANRLCTSIRSDGTTRGEQTIKEALQLSKRQEQIAQRLRDAYRWSNFATIVESIGGSGLLASEYFTAYNRDVTVPNNQWMLEAEHWFATILVMLESLTKSYVIGMPNIESNMYTVPSKEEEWMCHNQVVQSTDYASFNVLGLCIILFVGAAVIALNVFDNRLCRLILRKTKMNEHRQVSWEKHDLLELQAAALNSGMSRDSSSAASFDSSEESKSPQAAEKEPNKEVA